MDAARAGLLRYLPGMSKKSARREYLQAIAEFDAGCERFAQGMARILETSPPAALSLVPLGARKPAKRAPRPVPARDGRIQGAR
jgi:hypothetical protein